MSKVEFVRPLLPERLNVLERWFNEIYGSVHIEVSLFEFTKFLVSKGLTNDQDSAMKIVVKRLKLRQDEDRKFGLGDLIKMFCASIFKVSFIDMLKNIETNSRDIKEINL